MAWYYDDGESREDANRAVQRELTARRKRGENLEPVLPKSSRDLSTTFWGQAWNRNLMAYSDYESRMPRGRSYFRSGKVLGMKVEPGLITSVVAGSRVYDVEIQIARLAEKDWKHLQKRCLGKITDVMDLLAGDLSDDVMREVTDLKTGLFPSSDQIMLSCSCPDWAGMCKHAAATLYAVGSLLDDNPRHLFTLRNVDPQVLIGTLEQLIDALIDTTQPASDRHAALEGMDLGDIFGIAVDTTVPAKPPAKKAPRKKRPSP